MVWFLSNLLCVFYLEPWRGDEKRLRNRKQTIWIKSYIAIANYERIFSSSFTMSCHKPQVFSVKIIIFCRTTHLLQDVNNITHKESTLKIRKQTFHFQSYFYQFMKKYKTAKSFTLRTPHISTDLFFYFFILRQSIA